MTYLNAPYIGVRHPRTLLALGDLLLDFESITIGHSGTFQAGTFEATIRSVPGSDVGQWGWWLAQDVVILDIYFGFPADPERYGVQDLTRMAVCRVDNIKLNAAHNALVISGRDLSAILIDKKTSGQFQNQVSSDIAAQFASDAGLTANIQPTTTRIGTYYAQDHVQMLHEDTQWAFLVYLARKEGYQLFVLGRTLYFGNFGNTGGKDYLIEFDKANSERAYHACNAERLEFEHDLTLSRDVIVTVRSWNAKNKKGFTALAKSSSGKAMAARNLTPILPKSSADAQNYVYSIPGLSQHQAEERALQIAKEISQHEMRMTAEMPADDLLYPWVNIVVQGTDTLFDATYYPSEVTRSLSPTSASMHVKAKNHQTGTQVALS